MTEKRRRLNIALFHLAFIYSGGGEKLVLKEAEGLKRLGHKVDIYACVVNKKKCFPDLTKGVVIQEFLPWAKPLLKNHEAFQVVLTSLLAPFFVYKFRSYDLIFAANQPSLWIAYIAKFLFSKKYVGYLAQPTRFLYPRTVDKETGLYFVKKDAVSLSVKLMRIFRKFIKSMDTLSIKGAGKLLVNGEYMTGLINKIYKVQAQSCPAGAGYLTNPVGSGSKEKGKLKVNGYILNKPYILMTNRHMWQKRLEYGLTALSGLLAQKPEYCLVITGCQTDYTKELKVEINRMGLTNKVIFTGFIKGDSLKKLYKNATVYLYTAPQEDFGMGIIEAMGQGTPVIAWNEGGPSFTVADKQTGFLINSGDTESFTQKLIQVVLNRNLAFRMSKNAILRVKAEYSWKKHFYTIEQTLQSLLN